MCCDEHRSPGRHKLSQAKQASPTPGRGQLRAMLVLFLLLLSSLACAPKAADSGAVEQPALHELTFDGRTRRYQLILPASYQEAGSHPLVLALHGGGGSAERMCSLQEGIQTLVDRERFIVVCPQGVEGHWNDGRQIDNYAAYAERIDDVGFLTALTQRLIEDYGIDPKRVFITGFSNGGMMTYRMACERTGLFAAIAPSIANLPQGLECSPSRPIPVMILNGSTDPLMPFEGGQVGTRRKPLGQVLSTEATAQFWAAKNECDPQPIEDSFPARDPDDPSRIHLFSYQDCQNEADVFLYMIEGGGHTWPGGPQYAPAFVIGAATNQASTSELIWAFFKSHS